MEILIVEMETGDLGGRNVGGRDLKDGGEIEILKEEMLVMETSEMAAEIEILKPEALEKETSEMEADVEILEPKALEKETLKVEAET